MAARSAKMHWSEGMLLLPQHLQVFAQQVQADLDGMRRSWGPARWGVVKIDVAVGSDEVSISEAVVVMPSGTVVTVPGNCEVPVCALGDSLDRAGGRLDVLLGIPRGTSGAALVADATNPKGRYYVRPEPVLDENSMHPDSSAPVEFRFLNGKIFLDKEEATGYETIKIAEIGRESAHRPEPRINEGYIPPLTETAANSELVKRLKRLCVDLRDTNRALARDVAARDHTLALETGTDPEAIFKLNATNTQIPSVEHLCLTKGVHPFDTYRGLCELAGALAIFGEGCGCPKFKLYDHEDLAGCFESITETITDLLDKSFARTWDLVEFKQVSPRRYQCPLTQAWLNRDRELYLGVTCSDAESDDLERMITGGAIKLIGDHDVEDFEQTALPGLTLVRCPGTPSHLPSRHDVVYYSIERMPRARWGGVEQSEQLCVMSLGVDLPAMQLGLYGTKKR